MKVYELIKKMNRSQLAQFLEYVQSLPTGYELDWDAILDKGDEKNFPESIPLIFKN